MTGSGGKMEEEKDLLYQCHPYSMKKKGKAACGKHWKNCDNMLNILIPSGRAWKEETSGWLVCGGNGGVKKKATLKWHGVAGNAC